MDKVFKLIDYDYTELMLNICYLTKCKYDNCKLFKWTIFFFHFLSLCFTLTSFFTFLIIVFLIIVTLLNQHSFAKILKFLKKIISEGDRTKERLADILEDRGLSFLFPLLRIQADLWKQLQTDPSPTSLYRWIKENVDSSQHTVPGFVSALVSWYVTYM